MGNHRMEHRRHLQVNITSPIMLEMITIEAQRQPTKVIITQSLDVGIATTRVETIVAPIMDVVKKGVLIGCATKIG